MQCIDYESIHCITFPPEDLLDLNADVFHEIHMPLK